MWGHFSYHSHPKETLIQRDPWTQYPPAYWCIHICNITLNYLPHPACPAHNNIPSHNLSSSPSKTLYLFSNPINCGRGWGGGGERGRGRKCRTHVCVKNVFCQHALYDHIYLKIMFIHWTKCNKCNVLHSCMSCPLISIIWRCFSLDAPVCYPTEEANIPTS